MKNVRRERFVRYFMTVLKSDRAKLMQKTHLTKGRVTQLFDPDEPFGELAARNLADRLGLPLDYFERDIPTTHEEAMEQLGEKIARMPILPPDAIAIAQEFDQIEDRKVRRKAYSDILDIISEAIEPTPGPLDGGRTHDGAEPRRARPKSR